MQRGRQVIRIAAALVCACWLGAGVAEADSCSVSVTPVVFGTYNVFNTAPTDSTGSVVYRCTSNATLVWITMTTGSSGTFTPRKMARGSDRLNYNLYSDAARTQIWGNLLGGTTVYYDFNPPKKQDVVVTIYGRIPAQQDVRAGSYSDTVSLEMNF